MEKREQFTPKQEIDPKKKIAFFEQLAFKYLPEMRLLFRGGKLTKADKWRNVAEHSLVQVAAIEALAESIGLAAEDKEKLCKAAACHDWDKRLEKQPDYFTEEERRLAREFLQTANPDQTLMEATKMEWLPRVVMEKKASLLEKLQFYIDDICQDSEIVSLDERIDEAEARERDLGASLETKTALGGNYRKKERELGHEIETEVFEKLKSQGINIEKPELLPSFLRKIIAEKINKFEI